MKRSGSKVIIFLRKNSAYLVLALCVLAVGLSAAFVLIRGAKENLQVEAPIAEVNDPADDITHNLPVDNHEPIVEPVATVITFISPVNNPVSISNFSETPVFNSTLKRFSAHTAIDFYAAEGTSVFAVYGGIIESAENDLLTGVTVVIDHGNGLKTVYNSLESADDVVVGRSVAKGEKIGSVSSTNRQESSAGAHLHFYVIENGEAINPAKYLTLDEK